MPPDHVKKAQQQALQIDQTLANTKRLTPPTQPQTSLDQLLNDPQATWQFSQSGSGGASLITSPSSTGGGAAVKIEPNYMVKNAERCATFMSEFFSRVSKKDPSNQPPFLAPRISIYQQSHFSQNPSLKTELDSRLDSQKTPTLNDPSRIDTHKKNLTSMMTKDDCSVFVMEFGSGQALHTLSTSEKEALIRSRSFPESIGRSTALCVALGLGDHLGLTANPSNVLYDKATGTLTLIDYDAGRHCSKNNHQVIGSVNRHPETLSNMRQFLEQAVSSPADFQKALDQLCDPIGDTPFQEVMQCMLNQSKSRGNYLFSSNDDPIAVQDISILEKRDFAAHLLKGAVEGFAYLQAHTQSLKEAALSTHETLQDGTKLEHFYDQSQLAKLEQEVNKVDVAKLRTGLDNALKHREQNIATEFKDLQAKQDRALQLDQMITTRTTKPTLWQKVKDTFGWTSAVPKMTNEALANLRVLGIEKLNQIHQIKPGDYSRIGDLKDWTAFHQAANNPQTNAPSNQVTGTPQQTVAQQINTPSPKPSVKDDLSAYIGPNATKSLPSLPQAPGTKPVQGVTTTTHDNDSTSPKVRDVVRQDKPDTPTKLGPSQKL